MVWDEAREVLVVVLLAAATMNVAAPIVRWPTNDDMWDQLVVLSALSNVSVSAGLLLLGAAGVIATTPGVDVVPRLRRITTQASAVVTVLGVVAIALTLTADTAVTGVDDVLQKLGSVMSRSGPGTLLAGAAAWTARQVVPFPGG